MGAEAKALDLQVLFAVDGRPLRAALAAKDLAIAR